MISTFKGRLATWYVTLSILLVLLLETTSFMVVTQGMLAEKKQYLAQYAARVEEFAKSDAQNGDEDFLHEFDEMFSLQTDDEYIQITDEGGAILYLSSSLRRRHLTSMPASRNQETSSTPYSEVRFDGQMVLVKTVPIRVANRVSKVTIGISLRQLELVRKRLFLTMLLALPLAASFVLVASIFISRRLVEPLEEFIRRIQKINKNNLEERVELEAPDKEIGILSDSFNQMMARLDIGFKQIQRFTADTSHELRTPIAVLKGEIQIALTHDLSTEETHDLLKSNLEELNRMSRIVDDLLVLAQLDASAPLPAMRTVDFTDIVIETAEIHRPFAEKKSIELKIGRMDTVLIRGDQHRLSMMIRNVLENSLKFTPCGGRIELSLLGAPGNKCTLSFKDSGVGISSDDLPHVFERFYKSRPPEEKSSTGSGLGLNLVKWIVDAHSGTIKISSQPGLGTLVEISLPCESGT